MNEGIENEKEFVSLFNNKYLNELDKNSQLFLKELFNNNISNDEIIIAWKNHDVQKTDIFIKYKNYVKGISLKCGKDNSIHQERIQDFKRYLEKLGIPYKIVNIYMSYHYGYKRDENGNINYDIQLSSEEYKKIYQQEINIFNKTINNVKMIVEMVDRFIIKGRNADYDIDALIHGRVDNYVWLLKNDIYELIFLKRSIDITSPHIACLTIGPKKRNLSKVSNNPKERYIVCIRWHDMQKDIINYKSNK